MPVSPAVAMSPPAGGSRRRRAVAAAIDCILAIVLGLLLWSTWGEWAATRAASLLRVGDASSTWHGAVPLILGAVGNLSYALPLVVFLILLPEAFWGIGPGKAATGLRIAPSPSGTSSLLLRFLVKCSPCLAWFVALAVGQTWMLAVFAACSMLVSLGLLPLLRRGPALHDRLARTQVRANHPHDM